MVMSSFEHVPASGVVHRCCSHLVDQRFLRMIRDLVRFNREA